MTPNGCIKRARTAPITEYQERNALRLNGLLSTMVIGIDYDGTISADPAFWFGFANTALKLGHEVVVVTGRTENEKPPVGNLPCVCCGDEYKSIAASKAGYDIEIWIDDEPGHIEPTRKLAW